MHTGVGTIGGLLFVLGTRPEAIKLAPVVRALGDTPMTVCLTGQHPTLARAALDGFGLAADIDLGLGSTAPDIMVSAALDRLSRMIAHARPAMIVVQGDTSSSFAGALAAAYARVPLAHVEAGLRSGRADPFPEDLHRRLIAQMAAVHFAPTESSRTALLREGVPPSAIHVTGNTAIDAAYFAASGAAHFAASGAAHFAASGAAHFAASRARAPRGDRPLILVTAHRRENHGAPMRAIAGAVARLAARGDVEIACVLHPHPAAGAVFARRLRGVAGVTLLPPLDHADFVALLRRARMVLTDSGGVQEEAPAFGCPVLVLRDSTERAEGIDAGAARLVGTDTAAIVAAACELLDDDAAHAGMARAMLPYGDGHAGRRIAAIIRAAMSAG